MSSSPPPKPWERGDAGATHLSPSLPQSTNSRDDLCRPILNRGTLPSARSSSAMTDTPSTGSPPQPPPRSQNSTPRYGGMGYGGMGYGGMGYGGSGVGYGMGYGGYGGSYGGMNSPYGSAGMYGGYGRMGGGYNGEQSQFARVAEESSRPAFQSIENIVNAFGSVAMMLESTFYAVYNSFRAVIGVADHFTRMKAHFTQIFTTVAFIRPFLWLWRKLKHLLGYSQNVGSENAWSEVSKNGVPLSEDGKPKSSWPILLFFAVVFGGPWLIWKLLSSVQSNEASHEWATGEDDHFEAVAQYSFDGRSDDELSFRNGQRINIAPKELQPRAKGWLLASVDGKKGLIPVNYIKMLGKRRGRKKGIQNHQQQPPQPNAVDEERLLDDEFPQSDLEQQPYATAFPTQPNEDEEKIVSDILADNDSELTGQIDSS